MTSATPEPPPCTKRAHLCFPSTSGNAGGWTSGRRRRASSENRGLPSVAGITYLWDPDIFVELLTLTSWLGPHPRCREVVKGQCFYSHFIGKETEARKSLSNPGPQVAEAGGWDGPPAPLAPGQREVLQLRLPAEGPFDPNYMALCAPGQLTWSRGMAFKLGAPCGRRGGIIIWCHAA